MGGERFKRSRLLVFWVFSLCSVLGKARKASTRLTMTMAICLRRGTCVIKRDARLAWFSFHLVSDSHDGVACHTAGPPPR